PSRAPWRGIYAACSEPHGENAFEDDSDPAAAIGVNRAAVGVFDQLHHQHAGIAGAAPGLSPLGVVSELEAGTEAATPVSGDALRHLLGGVRLGTLLGKTVARYQGLPNERSDR